MPIGPTALLQIMGKERLLSVDLMPARSAPLFCLRHTLSGSLGREIFPMQEGLEYQCENVGQDIRLQ